MGQNDQKWPGARRSSAALWRGLQEFSSPQVIQEPTHQQSLSAEQQRRVCVCSWKYPVRGFQEELQIRIKKSQVTGLPHSIMSRKKSRETSKLWMSRKTRWCLSERWLLSCQDNSHSHWEEAGQFHGLAWWPSQPHQGWVFADESIHVGQALEPVWHWS